MRSANRFLPALAAVLLLPSCTDLFGPGNGESLRSLEAAEDKWDEAGLDDYVFTLHRTCFCGYVDPVRVSVYNDVVVVIEPAPGSDPFPSGFTPDYPSIRELFAIARDAIAMPASELDLEFDSETGHPTEMYVDWHSGIADDEIGYHVSDVAPLVTLQRAAGILPRR